MKTKTDMRKRIISLLISCFALWGSSSQVIYADTPIDDGVYYITCTKEDGYVGLGSYHSVDPYIYYVTDGQEKTADAYWVITHTESGYTFRNEATNDLLVFTYDRVDQYYKYMTLASESLGDDSEYWNIIQGSDGAYSIQSVVAPDYYWNLRSGTYMLGTYRGSGGNGANERYTFIEKSDVPGPGPGPGPDPEVPTDEYTPIVFPEALHVFLSDGRIEAYPLQYVTNFTEADGRLVIETNIDETFTYELSEVDSIKTDAPTDFPTFNSFKFHKNYNDQVFTTVTCEMEGDTLYASIGAIGKRLTPLYTLLDDNIDVYVNGKLQSEDGLGDRLRFDKDIYYLVAQRGCTILLPKSDTEGATYTMQPYGRCVRVHVDWLTDRAEVPTIYINTEDGQTITSKTEYKNAEIIIDGHGIFPSMDTTFVQIKGRGNSSWGWPKKPYRLKFEEKVKPLGMTKSKSWVLLSNYQRGSMMSNAIGMKAANLIGTPGANHIIPVDLYLNGEYRGSYNFTEKVGFSNNSVDLEDETNAALLELDSYYDEPVGQKFRSTPYNLPINIKEPDFSDTATVTNLTLETVQTSFNSFMSALYRGKDISPYVDIEQLVRFMMVDELTLNYEFYHPKSTFCYRENFFDGESKYVFGPVWDLDWCFGYQNYGNYFKNEATSNYWIDMPSMEVVGFIQDLRFKYEPLDTLYRRLWEEFMENDLQELLEYCQDYYDFAKNSFIQNRSLWSDYTDYATQVTEAENWLEARSEQIYADIVAGVRPDIPEPIEYVEFDNNKLYTITCPRGALVLTSDHNGLTVEQARYYDYEVPEEDYLFAIIGIEGQNYIYSPVTKKFLHYANDGNWVNQLGTPVDFDPTNPYGQYVYMMSCYTDAGQKLYFNHNSSILVINGYSTPDPGNRFLIQEVGDFDPTEALALAAASLYDVTNRYIWNGEVIGSETRKLPIGADPPVPSDRWDNAFVKLVEPDDMPYQVDGEMTIDYNVEWHGPFEFSSNDTDIYWYDMTIRTYYYVSRQEYEPYYPDSYVEDDILFSDEYLWAFGGNPYQVVLYNRTSGFNESLTADGENAVMRPGVYAWDLIPNSDGFVLRIPGTDYACINQFGSSSGPLQFWNDARSLTDDGSTFRIFQSKVDAIKNLKDKENLNNGAIYNLAGQRVDGRFKGVVIKNGKKVLVK